ncbi:MAG: glycosyltransferase family 39 protein [Vicinamibacteraceae bacterium]
MTAPRLPRLPRLLVVAAFALFTAWSLIVPINEAPDEPAHWQYARYLHDHWRLPHYAPGFEEANSPPLAYALFAPLAVDASSPDIILARRPNGEFVSVAEPRRFLNTGDDYRRFGWQRAARLLAVVISIGTVLFVWKAGVAAGGSAAGLLAALFVMLLPMFAFRAGHVSNDALLACGAAAATWGMVRLVREPFSWRVAWWTSAAVGLAYLSKISAIALVPPFAVALLAAEPAATWRVRAARLSALALAGAIVAPWSIRNIVLYGDPFASAAMRHAVAHLITDRSLFSSYFAGDFPRTLTKSLIGIFGWANVLMPKLFYRPYLALFALALGGAAFAIWRRRLDWRLAGVLAVAVLAALAVVVRINLQFTQPQGRYLLPGLPAFAVLLALGLRSLPGAAARAASPTAVGTLLLAGNLYALFAVVWPAYHPAPLRTLDSGERVMVPSFFSDLAVLEVADYQVTGPTPYWTTPIDVDASPFAAFEVRVQADAWPREQLACLRFGPSFSGLGTRPPACASWMADGREQRVRIPLSAEQGWTGQITHLRLDPLATGTPSPGTVVGIREPRLLPQAPPR